MALSPISPGDIKAISRPLQKLISVVSSGIGKLANPFLVTRNAQAEAAARKILAQADADALEIRAKGVMSAIEIAGPAAVLALPDGLDSETAKAASNLMERAQARITFQAAKEQANTEAVLEATWQSLPSAVNDQPVDENWNSHFFDAIRSVSETEMQQVWGRVLAMEVAKPGSFTLRSMSTLKNITREEAEIFRVMCEVISNEGFIINEFDAVGGSLGKYGLSYSNLLRLEDAGLLTIQENCLSELALKGKHTDGRSIFEIGIHGGILRIISKNEKRSVRAIPLTVAGCELMRLIPPKPREDFFSELCQGLSSGDEQWTFERSKS